MNPQDHPFLEVLRKDTRYKLEAYQLVHEALSWAQDLFEAGKQTPVEPSGERHVTGQQLCHALRSLAFDQYGLMAKTVLATWGITSTRDIGNVVSNMIEAGLMRKSPEDRREDFDDVFDFDTAFEEEFESATCKSC